VDQRHGLDAVLAVPQHLEHGRVVEPGQLQVEQAVDNLQVVFDAVMDLAKQQLLLLQSRNDAVLSLLALGDVASHRQDRGATLVMVGNGLDLDGDGLAICFEEPHLGRRSGFAPIHHGPCAGAGPVPVARMNEFKGRTTDEIVGFLEPEQPRSVTVGEDDATVTMDPDHLMDEVDDVAVARLAGA
jgi:hypothetical protein